MAEPKSLADVIANKPKTTALFETIPDVMKSGGRVEGFEALRDLILANWRDLAREFDIPLHALLKLVLETDRHAIFALMSEEKLGDGDKTALRNYKWFQNFLLRGVDSPLPPETKLSEMPGDAPEQEEDNGRDEDV